MYPLTELIKQELVEARFRIHSGEQLGAQPIRFVASKTMFIPVVMALNSTHIVILEKDEAMPHDIDNLFDGSFKLAKRINRIPLVRGMQFSFAIMPLVIGKNPDEQAILRAVSSPDMPRFAVYQFPVVVDITECRVAFFEGWKKFGGAIWPSLQNIVTKHIEPMVDEYAETINAAEPKDKGSAER